MWASKILVWTNKIVVNLSVVAKNFWLVAVLQKMHHWNTFILCISVCVYFTCSEEKNWKLLEELLGGLCNYFTLSGANGRSRLCSLGKWWVSASSVSYRVIGSWVGSWLGKLRAGHELGSWRGWGFLLRVLGFWAWSLAWVLIREGVRVPALVNGRVRVHALFCLVAEI